MDRNLKLGWALVISLIVIDIVWGCFAQVIFVWSFEVLGLLLTVAGLAATFLMLSLVDNRLQGDPAKLAYIIQTVSRRVRLIIHVVVFNIGLFSAFVSFTYLSATLRLPLWDSQLAAFDGAIGFDWLGVLALANSSPQLSAFLVFAYKSSAFQLLFVCVLLAAGGNADRLWATMFALALASVVAAALNVLVPAAGAYAHYRPPAELFSHLSPDAGMWHFKTMVALRTEASPVVDFAKAEGLVTFPSFHTVLAIITAYGFWRIPFAAIPASGLNLFVVVSTVPEGGHYVADLIAGAVIAVLAIACAHFGPITSSRKQSLRYGWGQLSGGAGRSG